MNQYNESTTNTMLMSEDNSQSKGDDVSIFILIDAQHPEDGLFEAVMEEG